MSDLAKPTKALNRSFYAARASKQDEFYTELSDIEKELKHYAAHFKGKTILCNCDDPRVSNFFHYFSYNFEKLGLEKLITTCYKSQQVDLIQQKRFGKRDLPRIQGRPERQPRSRSSRDWNSRAGR